jgi:hypothetical protein
MKFDKLVKGHLARTDGLYKKVRYARRNVLHNAARNFYEPIIFLTS